MILFVKFEFAQNSIHWTLVYYLLNGLSRCYKKHMNEALERAFFEIYIFIMYKF